MNKRSSIVRFELPIGLFGATLVFLAALFAHIGIPSWIPSALSLRFGVPSPFTGMTRSFVALISGNVAAAFAWHPLGPLVFAGCAVTPVVAVISLARGRRLALISKAMSSSWLWLGLAVLTALVWARQIVSL